MAKTTTCAFCGKELTTGFFKGDALDLYVGYDQATCCDSCYEQYKDEIKRVEKRLKIKIANYKTATKNKKLTSQQVADMVKTYLAEEKEQIARCGKIDTYTDLGYFVVNEENKCFAIREFELGSDVTAGQMVKSLKKSEETGDVWFSKDDVTRLEYRTTFVGESLGLFSSAYSFEIRLNDEKVITYKPCITKAAFIGKGLFPHSQKKKAKDQCAGLLVLLKETIGADLPVVEVKKFV